MILDFEDYELVKAWIGEKELEELCKVTLCVLTPHGGLHVYLTAKDIPPHKFNPAFVKEGKGIVDLQSVNSYVVGPWSCINHKHCDTDKCPYKGQDYVSCYTPKTGPEEAKITEFDLRGLLNELVKRGKRLGIEPSARLREWLKGEVGETEAKEDDVEKEYKELAEELKKRNEFTSVEKARSVICEKLDKKSAEFKVICEGKSYSEIGIDRSRGDYRVIKALLYHGLRDPDLILQILPPDSKAKVNEKWDPLRYYVHTLKKAWSVASKYVKAKRLAQKDKKSEAKGLMVEALAEEIIHEYSLVAFTVRDQVKESLVGLFRFSRKKGIYEPVDVTVERIISEKLEQLMGEFTLGSGKSSIIREVKDEVIRRSLKELAEEPLRIALLNGTLEWTQKGLTWYPASQRTREQFAFHFLPWNLKFEEIEKFEGKEITVQDVEQLAAQLCPKALEVFKQWVDDRWILLFEIIGYTLYPRYVFNKAILLVGSGSNGKSTFLNLLLTILTRGNVSAVPLKRIVDGDKFAPIELYHKLANISSELFAFKVTNTDVFKKLTGEDYIEGQKKFKDPIYFVNYAKLINATNELPVVKDQSFGFWRRWIVIDFPHQFEPDPTFFERTFTKEEIEGIITVSVVAFARVLQQKKFDFEDSSADIKEKWERASDSVYAFVKELLESGRAEYDPKNGDLFTPTDEFYNAYVEWCNANDRRPEPKATVTKRLETRFRITKDRKKIGGERVWCYVGIRLKSEPEEGPKDYDLMGNEKLLSIYEQYKGKVVSVKDLVDVEGLKAYSLLEWCQKKNLCHYIDEEHVGFD